jgi:hypothetical protein
MQKKLDLASDYPRSEDLFRWLVAYGHVKIEALVVRATQINLAFDSHNIAYILEDLSEILGEMSKNAGHKAVKPLLQRPIFPITRKEDLSHYDKLVAIDDQSWFIADMPFLQKSFQGKISLLAFTVVQISQMEHLFRALGLASRTLSKIVYSRTSPKGPLQFSARRTKALRDRIPFIQR